MTFTPVVRTLLPILSLFFAFSILAFQHIENNQETTSRKVTESQVVKKQVDATASEVLPQKQVGE